MTPYDFIILDECESIFMQMSSDTMEPNFPESIKTFEHFILSAKHVIGLDAFVSDRSYYFFEALNLDFDVFLNVNQPTKRELTEVLTNRREGETGDHIDDFLEKMVGDMEQGLNIYVVVSSKHIAKTIHQRLLENDFTSRLYTGDETDAKKELKQDVNEIWDRFQAVVTTTTITVGIDFNKEHFDKCYIYVSSGESSPCFRDLLQASMRVRQLRLNKVVFACNPNVVKVGNCPVIFSQVKPHLIAKILNNNSLYTSSSLGVATQNINEDSWLLNVQARNQLELNMCRNLKTRRTYLKKLFITAGYITANYDKLQPKEREQDDLFYEEIKSVCGKFADTLVISNETRELIASKLRRDECSKEEKEQLFKHDFSRLFVENSAVNIEELYDSTYAGDVSVQKFESDVLFMRYLKTENIVEYLAQKGKKGMKIDPSLLKSAFGKVMIMRQIFENLDRSLDSEKEFTRTEIEGLFDSLAMNRECIQVAFDLRNRSKEECKISYRSDVALLNKIFGTLDLALEKTNEKKIRINGRQIKVPHYKLEPKEKAKYNCLALYESLKPFQIRSTEIDMFIKQKSLAETKMIARMKNAIEKKK